MCPRLDCCRQSFAHICADDSPRSTYPRSCPPLAPCPRLDHSAFGQEYRGSLSCKFSFYTGGTSFPYLQPTAWCKGDSTCEGMRLKWLHNRVRCPLNRCNRFQVASSDSFLLLIADSLQLFFATFPCVLSLLCGLPLSGFCEIPLCTLHLNFIFVPTQSRV